jgi:hypothetical protein
MSISPNLQRKFRKTMFIPAEINASAARFSPFLPSPAVFSEILPRGSGSFFFFFQFRNFTWIYCFSDVQVFFSQQIDIGGFSACMYFFMLVNQRLKFWSEGGVGPHVGNPRSCAVV